MEEEGTFGNQSGQREKHDEPTCSGTRFKIADHALEMGPTVQQIWVGLKIRDPKSNGVYMLKYHHVP
jgi:hypothetical protein